MLCRLLDAVLERGFKPKTCTMDKGCDTRTIHIHKGSSSAAADPSEVTSSPVLRARPLDVSGRRPRRKLTKWRCPTSERKPASVWRKASRLHPLIPRESKLVRRAILGSEEMVVYDDTISVPVRIFNSGVSAPTPGRFGDYRLTYRAGRHRLAAGGPERTAVPGARGSAALSAGAGRRERQPRSGSRSSK